MATLGMHQGDVRAFAAPSDEPSQNADPEDGCGSARVKSRAMRRHLAAVLAAALSLGAVGAAPMLSGTSASASETQHAATRPHTALTTGPVKGIAIALGYANQLTDAQSMVIANQLFSMVSKKLHANAVSLNFAYWQSSTISNDPMRAPMTPSPQRLMAITAVAHRYHLAVQWRPYLFEPDLEPSRSHNSIKPTNAKLWLQNYWTFLQPYLEAANLCGAYSFSIALELRTLLPHLALWTSIVQRSKALFSGQILYSQQHLPQVTLPLTARGYDAYQPITLPSPNDVSVAAFTRGFEHNLEVPEMQSTPADLTLEEVGIPAQRHAYLQPSNFHYPPGTPMSRPVQTDWFTGACNAFYQLHLAGIYYYSINFNRFTPQENQSSSIYGWLGTPSEAAIAQCFARTPDVPVSSTDRVEAPLDASVVPSTLRARTRVAPRAAPTPTWDAAQLIEPTGGHPTSVSCPTSSFCAEVDLGGDVLTETAGIWSAPTHIDQAGLVSVSCASTTLCLAVDEVGDALIYDGSTWDGSRVDSVPMSSVSCITGSATCVAVDVAGRAFTFSAGTWSAPSQVATSPLTAVSCATTSYCVAVDDGGSAHTYTGTWSSTSLGTSSLTSVACATTSLCVAGDDAGSLYRDVAGSWTSHAKELPLGVASVSCASPTRCVALGATNISTATKGTSWARATPAFTGDGGVSVSCAPLGACTAAAYAGTVAVRTLNWSPATVNDPRPGNVTGVSCASSTFCAAVDDAGRAMLWNGATWSKPAPTGLPALSGVSCVGGFCVAVSVTGRVVEYAGGAWGKSIRVDFSPLTAVSCASATFCAATDASNQVVTFDGLRWAKPTNEGVPQTMVRGYTAVSCVAPSWCVAVNTDGSELFFGAGTAYLYQADTKFVPLTGISCSSSSFCVAVDEQGREVTFRVSGTTFSWSRPKRIDPYRLTAVSCAADGYCLASDDNGGTVAGDGGAWGAPLRSVPLGAISAVACVASDTCAAADTANAAFSTATI
jgi:glycosyl hydrolase family 113